MNGERTAVVLGAGASYCYEDGNTNFPTQYNIIERLVANIKTSCVGAPTFCSTSGMKHSHGLSQFMRQKYNIPENSNLGDMPTDYFPALQKMGFSLESLYAEIEQEILLSEKHGYDLKWLLEDFEAIIRTSVMEPNYPRGPKNVCRYHRMLCEALQPGDYIINFNWDTVMADALLYKSCFWFPSTGFGLSSLYPFLYPSQKSLNISSLVQLYHIHGSVCLYEWEHDQDKFGEPTTLYKGPKSHSHMNDLLELMQVTKGQNNVGKINRNATDDEIRKNTLGYIYHQNEWFKPIFVPPSKYKNEYSNWYSLLMRRNIHSSLPSTKQIIIAGYSFPDADIEHLAKIFVRSIIPSKAKITIIDPQNQSPEFKKRVNKIFPEMDTIDYSFQDFREYCLNLQTSSYLKDE